jgi:hypothetical protein
MRLSQETLDVILVVRHIYCVERHSGTCHRGFDGQR